MSNYLVPKYLYKASDFINPKKINSDIAKIMNGVTVTNTDNLTDLLKSADQIQSTTTDFLNTVLPESQKQSIPTTTDSQNNQSTLDQLVNSQNELTDPVNLYIYFQKLSFALQSVVNYIYNGGVLNSDSVASSLSSDLSSFYPYSNLYNNNTSSDNLDLTNFYPSSILNNSYIENLFSSSDCFNNTNYRYDLTNSSSIYANSSAASDLFNLTNSNYVNNYLLSPPNLV